MTLSINFIIVLGCIIGLWLGASWIVESASRIAKKLGLSDLVIGLSIVAIATSAPEFVVTVSASLQESAAISLGNVVGSNIFNLGLILGLVVIFTTIRTTKLILFREGALLLFTSLILIVFFNDLTLRAYEGIILMTILISYLVVLFKNKETLEDEVVEGKFRWTDIPLLILGAATIILSGHFFVEASKEIAAHFGISEWLIGITVVAAGTSAPELATSIVAIVKGKHGISAGNLIGSDLFNLLGVLGVAGTLHPITITSMEYTSLFLMLASMLILLVLIRTGWKLTRLEGFILILVALFRWSFDFIF